jgi:flagellar motor switch protein FliN/FliY
MFGEETALSLSQTLTALLGRDASVTLSQVLDKDSVSFGTELTGSFLCATLRGSGGVDGMSLLLTKEKDSSIIADLLIGQDGANAPEKMTELHLSAFGEVLQQITEVLTRGVQKYAGSKAQYLVKDISTLESSALGQQLSHLGNALTVFHFSLFVQDLLSGEILFCLPESAVSRMSSGPGKPTASAPAPAVQMNTGVVDNTQTRAGGTAVQQFENEYSGSARPAGGNIGLLLDVPLKLTVELGRTTKLVKEILALAPGSVVELDKLAGEAVDILVNEKLIAKGEVVVIDENFGVRITEILNPEERLTAVQS